MKMNWIKINLFLYDQQMGFVALYPVHGRNLIMRSSTVRCIAVNKQRLMWAKGRSFYPSCIMFKAI